MSIAEQLDELGVGISHHFGGGAYVKETDIPSGTMLAQHKHDHDHLSYLVRGEVRLMVDDRAPVVLFGPACVLLEAGHTHAVHAVTDAVWLCIWATDCTDPERVDDVLTAAA